MKDKEKEREKELRNQICVAKQEILDGKGLSGDLDELEKESL